MLTIGLLGGMSWESSIEYYRLANELVRDRSGGLRSAQCVLYSVDFAPIEAMQAEGRWDDAARVLATAARAVEAAGANVLLLCTNTMHKVADDVQAAIDIPMLHIADVTAAAVAEAGLRHVGLLATAYTMEQRFYRERLEGHGLDISVPEDADRATVHRIIYDELCQGIVLDESRQQYIEIITRLVGRGAEGVILGCTEIELLISAADVSVPVFPTTRLHAEAAVAYALGSSSAGT